MKKVIGLLLLICFLSNQLGCTSQKTRPPKQTICYWTTSDIKKNYMLQMADTWNSAHPEQFIDLQVVVFEEDQIDAKLWTTLHAGVIVPGMKPPDLVDIEFQNFEKYVSPTNCLLSPLDTIVARYMLRVNNHTELDSYRYRGFYFGIPFGADNMVAIYNESLLADYGFTSKGVITWSDFNRLGRVIHRQSGKHLISIDMNSYLFFTTLLLQFSEQDGTFCVDEEAYRAALGMAAALYNNNVATLMPGGRTDSRTFIETFVHGDILCALIRQSNVAEFLEACSGMDSELVIQKIPRTGDKHEIWIPGYATAIPVGCESFELVQEFLYFSKLTEQAQQAMQTTLNSGLAMVSLADDPLYVSDAVEFGKFLARYELDLIKKIYDVDNN